MRAMMRSFLIGASLAITLFARANVMHRLYVADTSDFGKKLGFYIDFENEATDGQACKLETLRAFLGVADGSNWRFTACNGPFHFGQTLHLSATIAPTGSTFSVDGATKTSDGGFKPGLSTLTASNVPGWASGSTEYRLVETALSVKVGAKPYVFSFPSTAGSPVLALFGSAMATSQPVSVGSGDTIVVEATVRIDAQPNVNDFKPLLDAYGQLIQSNYPGKISSDDQLKNAFAADDRLTAEWKPRKDVDSFGGELGVSWAAKGSGFYKTVKRNGTWWLQTPLGNPVFYTGVCTAPAAQWDSTPVTGREDYFQQLPPKTGIQPSLWSTGTWGKPGIEQAALHAMNLVKRFGPTNYDAKAHEECRNRLAAWGFSGLGKWSEGLPNTPYLPVLGCPDVPKIDRHFDVFDPSVVVKLKASLSTQILPNLKNPYVLGYSYGNEYDEIITPSEVVNILKSPMPSPAKAAFIDHALAKLYGGDTSKLAKAWGGWEFRAMNRQPLVAPASDVEALRQFYATKYYSTMYSTVKSIDPNHLYFGFWIVPDWWVSDVDWNLIAPNVDVIGFDRYADWPGIENLLSRFDKPVLLGEFSFPAWYEGQRGFGRYSVYTQSDKESGQRYTTLLEAAAKCPQCVGTMWFQYRDEPITGRGPIEGPSVAAGENYAFGLIDACDLPKLDLVRAVREANLAANRVRLKASN